MKILILHSWRKLLAFLCVVAAHSPLAQLQNAWFASTNIEEFAKQELFMLLVTHVDYIAGRLMRTRRLGLEALVGAINQLLFVHMTRLTLYVYVNQY